MLGLRRHSLLYSASVVSGLLCLAGIACAGNPMPLPDPVAQVNGEPITRLELRREVGRLERNAGVGAGITLERELELLREALNNIVDRNLLYREARRDGTSIPSAEVTAEVARLRGDVEQSIEFERTLSELNLTENDLNIQAERSMIARAFIDKRFAGKTEPSEVDIAAYYDRNPALFRISEQQRIAHILVKFENPWQLEKKEAARQKALRLHKRVKDGEDFAGLARESSDCPSRNIGGDLGWFRKGALASFMERTASGLKVGGISEPIDDRFGYHILKVTDRKGSRTVPIDEARPKIREYLRQEQAVRKAREFTRTLREKAKVEIFIPKLEL